MDTPPVVRDIHRDLNDARGLLEQSGSNEERKKYRKAAEIILLKALKVDPENEEAKALLQCARALPAPLQAPPPVVTHTPVVHIPAPAPTPVEVVAEVDSEAKFESESEDVPEHMYAPAENAHAETVEQDLPFTAAPSLFQTEPRKKTGLKLPIAVFIVAALGGGLLLMRNSKPADFKALAAPAAQPASGDRTQTPAPGPQPQQPVLSESPAPAVAPATAAGAQVVAAAPQPAASSTLPSDAGQRATVPPINVGTLAVSASAPAEIYKDDQLLGSTPATLQLPAGRHTIEYRHGDLRTVLTHNIKTNQTTTASVGFQMTVQVNAKPWAQVFLDGAPRRPLGQTPLGVTVPIGGVLVFENPNFSSKSYRVTDKDNAIQVNFP